jgi:hypothetical protein
MLLQHIALLSTVPSINASELALVGAALQKQVSRDLSPLWDIIATVDVFPTFEDVPLGYWPLIVVDDAPEPGLHKDFNHQPIAYVINGSTWSLAASHELIEMLIEPTGDRTVAGDAPVDGGGRVEFLVEACDPCQDVAFAYTVNGVLVSDFCTKVYFDPVAAPSIRYSFRGAITKPHEVLEGGYLTWREPASQHWIQLRNAGGNLATHDLGPMAAGPLALRTMIDAKTPEKRELSKLPASNPQVARVRSAAMSLRQGAAEAQAKQWRELIRSILGGAGV